MKRYREFNFVDDKINNLITKNINSNRDEILGRFLS